MRKKSNKYGLRKLVAILTIATTAFGSIASGLLLDKLTVKAAITKEETKQVITDKKKDTKDLVDLRMIFTTDLHGMLSSTDYLSGTDYKNQGLSLAYPLINKTREEKNASNVFTFDVGDVLFEASMEYIYGQDEEAIQPVYLGMSLIGYDAITLGNHDFDYGKDYLLRQLTYSGLLNKTVVSNLKNAKNNSYPFHENMIIERQAVTQQGNTVNIKVGVIGETIPTLSAKTDNYAGIWKTEDIITNVTKEAALLKEKGADLIVVLAHSGFGSEEPVENADNVSYALTKIPDVDVILCGHEHNEFPVANKSGTYYDYTGVDANTGLVNGKLIVMAKNQGKSIGVADVSLSYDKNGNFKIEKQSGEVRRISDYKLYEDSRILSFFDSWKEELEIYRTKSLIELEEGVTLQNYLGLLGDNAILQLQNDARIAYARKYIESVDKSYAGYPIIAAASHITYGANSGDDFVNITENISTADLFTVQNYRNYTYLYKITGAQLKEWLEFSASAYNTLEIGSKDNQFLIHNDWLKNWSKFFVFDGINYSISPYIAPRYDITGTKINDTFRVSSITYNGKEVTDDMDFIIACNSITPTGIFSWASSQKVKGMYRTQYIIIDYLTSLNLLGKYTPMVDNNWTIKFRENQEFLMLIPNQGAKFVKESSMYDSKLFETDDSTIFKFKAVKSKVEEPHIVALQSVLEPTNKGYTVYVDAFSSAGIKSLKYVSRDVDIEGTNWNVENDIENNQFVAYFNDTYTIYAEDYNGKKAIYKVIIDNIGAKEMAAPKVWSFTNKKTAVTGKSEAGAKVCVKIGEKIYSNKANSDGSYSVAIPAQISSTSFYVYAEDEKNERKSEMTKVYVKYAVPNVLSVNKYYNNSQYLTGSTSDKDNFIIVVDADSRTVYVPDENTAQIVGSTQEVDFSNYNITIAPQNIDQNGKFEISLPNIDIGTQLRVVNMDYVGRVGVSSYVKVGEGGPYAPEFHNIIVSEDTIYGNVRSLSKQNVVMVLVTVDGVSHTVMSDKEGNFKVTLDSPITPITSISAYAKETDGSQIRKSRISYAKADEIVSLNKSEKIKFSKTSYNSSTLTVTYLPDESIAILIPYVSGTEVVKATTNSDGAYKVKLKGEMVEGTLVKVTSRNSLGKLVDSSYSLVTYRQPTKPELISDLNNSVKFIKVVTKENCKLFVDIDGTPYYVSERGTYNKANNGYVHIVEFDRLPSGTKISMYAQNVTTNSKRLSKVVKKKAPDAPTSLAAKSVKNGAIQITGKVELFLINSEKEPTLKLTKTAVYARVNGTNYSGIVKEDGTFVIQIPAITEDTDVSIFAYNRYGYGPETSFKVLSKS